MTSVGEWLLLLVGHVSWLHCTSSFVARVPFLAGLQNGILKQSESGGRMSPNTKPPWAGAAAGTDLGEFSPAAPMDLNLIEIVLNEDENINLIFL